VIGLAVTAYTVAAAEDRATEPVAANGFVWESPIPADCPFPRSPTLTGISFTGRSRAYRAGDTWYPSWARHRTASRHRKTKPVSESLAGLWV